MNDGKSRCATVAVRLKKQPVCPLRTSRKLIRSFGNAAGFGQKSGYLQTAAPSHMDAGGTRRLAGGPGMFLDSRLTISPTGRARSQAYMAGINYQLILNCRPYAGSARTGKLFNNAIFALPAWPDNRGVFPGWKA